MLPESIACHIGESSGSPALMTASSSLLNGSNIDWRDRGVEAAAAGIFSLVTGTARVFEDVPGLYGQGGLVVRGPCCRTGQDTEGDQL